MIDDKDDAKAVMMKGGVGGGVFIPTSHTNNLDYITHLFCFQEITCITFSYISYVQYSIENTLSVKT